MADAVEILAGELTHEHVGRELLLDNTVWGPRVGMLTAVRQGDFANLTVSLRPYADRGPVPLMVHCSPDLSMRLLSEEPDAA